jgi:CHAD domain-containing protein
VRDVGDDVGDAVRARLHSRWTRLGRALWARPDEPGPLHELRLAVKHSRYATEALAPLLGIDVRRDLKMLRRLQDCLGEHRDATEALDWLNGLGEPLGPVLTQCLAGPVEKLRARRMRELGRIAGKFSIPRLSPRPAARRRLSPGRRPRAGRSARS